MSERNINNVSEEHIEFVSQFLLDTCKVIDPTIPEKELRHRVTAIQMPNEKVEYFLDNKFPLITVDLRLLIDGT